MRSTDVHTSGLRVFKRRSPVVGLCWLKSEAWEVPPYGLRCPKLTGGAVTRLRAAVYAASNALEAAKLAEYGDQLNELTATMEEIRRSQEATDLRAAQRRAGTLPPWERRGEIGQ